MSKNYIATFTSTVKNTKFTKNYVVEDLARAQELAKVYLSINNQCTLDSVEELVPDVPEELIEKN